MKNRPFVVRLGFALSGIRTAWNRERSFRTQAKVALTTAVILVWLQPGWLWVTLVAIAAGMVLALEAMNSALEYLIDHIHPAQAKEIGRAKDAAAGAVPIASATAVIVGLAMFAAL